MTKDININEYICDKMLLLKQEHPKYYKGAYNIITFLYKDVDKDYISKLKDKYSIEDAIKRVGNGYYGGRINDLEKERDELFNTFVNGSFGIIECLFELCLDKDERFPKKFFESVEFPITMLRDGTTFDSLPTSYIYNLYIMLYAYHVNKENYENFEAIIDDIKHSFIKENSYYGKKEAYFSDKKKIIDSIVENPNYYRLSILRSFLKKILSRFKYSFDEKERYQYREMIEDYQKLYQTIASAKKEEIAISEETVKEIEEDIALRTEYERNSYNNPEIYFERILLFNKRYQFIKERLPKLDQNINFKKQVVGHFANMDNSFFEYLNSLNIYDGDSFIEMMKIVFNSDSFKALFSRLGSIMQASLSFQRNEKETALQMVKELASSKHNSYDNGIEVVLPQTNINITKPESISERMILFYQINFGLCQKPKCLENYRNNRYSDISDFISDLEKEVEESRKADETPETVSDKASKVKKGLFSRF